MNTSIFRDKKGKISSIKLRFLNAQLKLLLEKWNTDNGTEAIFLEDGGIRNQCVCGAFTTWQRTCYSKYCSTSCASKSTAKHGKDHHLSSPNIIEKRAKTNLEKYGVDNPLKRTDIKNKIKETNQEKYGAEWFLGSAHGKKKAQDSIQEKYGVNNVSKVKDIQLKKIKTSIEKYGVQHPSKNPLISSKHARAKIQSTINRAIDENEGKFKPLFKIDDYSGCHELQLWKCLTCNNEVKTRLKRATYIRCWTCEPACHGTSNLEQRVIDFIKNLIPNETVLERNRSLISPYELDIVIPDRKLAIEVNGTFWYSTYQMQDPKYHLNKSLKAKEQGYRLIHLFSDELEDERGLSRLADLLAPVKVHGRKCTVNWVNSTVARQFLDLKHSQGAGPKAKHYVGLWYLNELVGIASFGKARWNDCEYELLRQAFSKQIIGGASKMFKFWVSQINPESVLTYSERRWNLDDAVYGKLGFVLDGDTGLDFWYVGNSTDWKRISRQKYQKHKLIELGGVGTTEEELAASLGLYRIYGCGNLRWKWKRA